MSQEMLAVLFTVGCIALLVSFVPALYLARRGVTALLARSRAVASTGDARAQSLDSAA